MSKTATAKAPTTIACPHCGNDDLRQIEYAEDVISTRTLERLEDGTLYYSPDSYEWVEFGENHRLSCKKCSKDFPIPEGLNLDIED